jgi:hypothetical protein
MSPTNLHGSYYAWTPHLVELHFYDTSPQEFGFSKTYPSALSSFNLPPRFPVQCEGTQLNQPITVHTHEWVVYETLIIVRSSSGPNIGLSYGDRGSS